MKRKVFIVSMAVALIGAMFVGCMPKMGVNSDSTTDMTIEINIKTEEETTTEELTEEQTEDKESSGKPGSPLDFEVIQRNCMYVTASGKKLKIGDVIPLQPTVGDVFYENIKGETCEYIYVYNEVAVDTAVTESEKIVGWTVLAVDTDAKTYGEIREKIGTTPVTIMYGTFSTCTNLEEAPEIPESIKYMPATFIGCTNLKEAPEIPEGVINLQFAFAGCSELVEAPQIPESVQYIDGAFRDCTKLEKSPEIPEGIKYAGEAFSNCKSLTGEVVFNANPERYEGCFSEVDFEKQNLSIVGTTSLSDKLKESRNEKIPYMDWSSFRD